MIRLGGGVRVFDGPVFVLADNLTGAIRSASDSATLTATLTAPGRCDGANAGDSKIRPSHTSFVSGTRDRRHHFGGLGIGAGANVAGAGASGESWVWNRPMPLPDSLNL